MIIKNALVGRLNYGGIPLALARMFVNISPSKYDTAVTNRSLKFAISTGKAKSKFVDKVTFKKLMKKSEDRNEQFQNHGLKLLKCSPDDELLDYQKVYPETLQEIEELLYLKDKMSIIPIKAIGELMIGFNLEFNRNKVVLFGKTREGKRK